MVSARLLLLAPLVILATSPAVARQDPARTDGWVVIPVDDYRALRAKAFPVESQRRPRRRRRSRDTHRLRPALGTELGHRHGRDDSGRVQGRLGARTGARRPARRRGPRRRPACLARRSAVSARAAVQARAIGAHAECRAAGDRGGIGESLVGPAGARGGDAGHADDAAGRRRFGRDNAWIASASETGGQSAVGRARTRARGSHVHMAPARRLAPSRTAAAPARQRDASGGRRRGRHASDGSRARGRHVRPGERGHARHARRTFASPASRAATVGDWETVRPGAIPRELHRSADDNGDLQRHAAKCVARVKASSRCRCCACRRQSGRPAASPSRSSALER